MAQRLQERLRLGFGAAGVLRTQARQKVVAQERQRGGMGPAPLGAGTTLLLEGLVLLVFVGFLVTRRHRLKAELATLAAMVQTGLELRYADAAKAQLLAKGQDTGTTHIEDAGFDITVEIGKDVKWEPKGLTELVAKIQASGSDPREYVEIKYSVSEAKFKAWPQTLRAPFEALRTVTPKAPKFVLRRAGEGQ